jgi:uncharacterized protein (DUF433 family)
LGSLGSDAGLPERAWKENLSKHDVLSRGLFEVAPKPKWELVPHQKGKLIRREEWIVERLRRAAIMLRDVIEINERRRGGIPVLAGTRFTIAQVLGELADGRNVKEIAELFELDLDQIVTLLQGLSIHLDRSYFE